MRLRRLGWQWEQAWTHGVALQCRVMSLALGRLTLRLVAWKGF